MSKAHFRKPHIAICVFAIAQQEYFQVYSGRNKLAVSAAYAN